MPIHCAVAFGQTDAISMLLDAGADVSSPGQVGQTYYSSDNASLSLLHHPLWCHFC
jgi:ankyrin repeat protein